MRKYAMHVRSPHSTAAVHWNCSCYCPDMKKHSDVRPVLLCCYRPIYFGGSPFVQGETCATFCSVSRGLHLSSELSCPTRTNRDHTGGGLFYFFCVSFSPHRPPAELALIFLSREGFGRPNPSSTPEPLFFVSFSSSCRLHRTTLTLEALLEW